MKMKLFGKANTKKDGSCMTDLENEIILYGNEGGGTNWCGTDLFGTIYGCCLG